MRNTEDPRDEEPVGRVYDAVLLRRLLVRARPHSRQIFHALGLILISSLLQLAGPLITAITLDVFVRPDVGASDPGRIVAWGREVFSSTGWSKPQGIAWMGGIYAATLIAAFWVLYLQNLILQLTGQKIMYELRRDIFNKLQQLPVSYLDRHPVGRLVTRATTDVASLQEVFTSGLVSILGDLLLLTGIVLVLFAMDWRLALASFTILPFLFALTVWFKSRARQSYREVRVTVAKIGAFLQEHLTGMSLVQLFGREEQALDRFVEINAEHRDANIRAIYYYAIYSPLVELITACGLATIVWYGGGRILEGALSAGVLVAFLQYAQRFYQPLADLSEKYNVLQSAMAGSERIFALLDEDVPIATPQNAHRPGKVRGRIEFEGVGFAYDDDEPVLEDITFRIEPGETIAVVGHTGAGKSTLANLLLRFYDVDRGAIRVDDVDLRRWDLETLRSAIGAVPQEVFLFSGDVASNIGMRSESVDLERIRWAAQEVHALELIERMPRGFATPVGERGAGLSVGEKQLIAFARALAFDPRILILDEATASIDSETEHLIQKALDRLLKNRTSLVIAHRLSTIQKADRILVLHKGRLREQGNHRELLEIRGIYHKLHLLHHQSAARPIEGTSLSAS